MLSRKFQDIFASRGLTICGRFNYKQLLHESLFWKVASPEWDLLWMHTMYTSAFFGFGNRFPNGSVIREKSYANWIIKDPIRDKYLIWIADSWHSLCLAFHKPTSEIILVKVSDKNMLEQLIFCCFSGWSSDQCQLCGLKIGQCRDSNGFVPARLRWKLPTKTV